MINWNDAIRNLHNRKIKNNNSKVIEGLYLMKSLPTLTMSENRKRIKVKKLFNQILEIR